MSSVTGEWAEAYARDLGWWLLPVWGIDLHTGFCTCPKREACGSDAGKHPHGRLAPHGEKDASCDLTVIRMWWQLDPRANVALACGPSGMLVPDGEAGEGVINFLQWAAGFGVDPEQHGVPESLTGGGGAHWFWRRSGDVRKRERFLPGVDLRGSTGYVLLPPSTHRSGNRYEWRRYGAPPLAPPELEQRLAAVRGGGSRNGSSVGDVEEYDYKEACRSGPGRGHRDDFFNRRAYQLRRDGWSWDAAWAEMRRHWEHAEHGDDEYDWDRAQEKLVRVWQTVEAEPPVSIPWDWLRQHAGLLGTDPGSAADAPNGAERPDGAPESSGGADEVHVPADVRGRDVANAERLVQLIEGRWLWNGALGWCYYRNGRWVVDEDDHIQEHAKEVSRRLALESAAPGLEPEQRSGLLKQAQEAGTVARVKAMIELARSDPRVVVNVSRLDRDPWILVSSSGTVELERGKVREHRPDDLVTMGTPVPLVEGFASERFRRYLLSTFGGDPDLVAYAQRVVGSTLVGKVREKALYVLLGPPDSGKTTFANLLQTALGELAMFVAPEYLLMGRSGQGNVMPQHELARMRGKRLVVSDEPQQGARWAEGLLKQLTGDDTVTGCFKYKHSFEMRPTWSIMVAANHVPRVNDRVMASRVKVLPTTRPPELDPGLREEAVDPTSELARAMLAWAVQGTVRWRSEGGVGTCSAVEIASGMYRTEQDVTAQFIFECLVKDPEGQERLKMLDVYHVYERWSAERGENAVGYRRFMADVEECVGRSSRNVNVGKVLVGYRLADGVLRWPGQGV